MASPLNNGTKKEIARSGFFWNMMGSGMNAASTLLLTVFVTQLNGTEDAGILAFAISVSFVFATVAGFEVRPYQSTDIKGRFSFPTYLTFRVITCGMALIFALLYIGLYGASQDYSPYKSVVLLLLCLYRMFGMFSDVFQGLFQQRERMDWAGKSLFIYVFTSVTLFLLILILTRNMLWSAVAMAIAVVLCILLYDLPRACRLANVRLEANWKELKALFLASLPLFLVFFMNMYTTNAARFEIDRFMPELQAYWTPIFMPAFVINLFSLFLFRPLLTTLTDLWNNGRLHTFAVTTGKLLLAIVGFTAAALGLGWFFGIPVLQLLYGLELTQFRTALLVTLVGGGFNAASVLLYYIVTIMRKQRWLLGCETVTFLASLTLTPLFISRRLLNGASLSYMFVLLIRTVLFAGVAIIFFVQKRKAGGNPAP